MGNSHRAHPDGGRAVDFGVTSARYLKRRSPRACQLRRQDLFVPPCLSPQQRHRLSGELVKRNGPRSCGRFGAGGDQKGLEASADRGCCARGSGICLRTAFIPSPDYTLSFLLTSGSFPRAFWADVKANPLPLRPHPSPRRNPMNPERNQGPGRALRGRASVAATGLCARHRLLPGGAFVVRLNQVTAHRAASFGLTCVFPGKFLAQDGHSWSHWNWERAGGQRPDASLRVSLLRAEVTPAIRP